jgi:hypothetical protein
MVVNHLANVLAKLIAIIPNGFSQETLLRSVLIFLTCCILDVRTELPLHFADFSTDGGIDDANFPLLYGALLCRLIRHCPNSTLRYLVDFMR